MSLINVEGKRWKVKVVYCPYLSVSTRKGVVYVNSGDREDVTHHLTEAEIKDVFVMAKSQGCMNSEPGFEHTISNAEVYICRAGRSGLTSPSIKIDSLGGHEYECYRGEDRR